MGDELQYETFQLFGIEASEFGLQSLVEWALSNLEYVEGVGVDQTQHAVCARVAPGPGRRKEIALALERLGFRVARSAVDCHAEIDV
ncbi:MAG: hypothetical protein M0R74_16805 [Dehalococcoidia bacterium]|nr:hypothetical protein [Dehalococcoidia bacterium]